jgi:hypothetical protein
VRLGPNPVGLESTAMDGIFATIDAAAGMFAGTNVDDIIVLTVLFCPHARPGSPAHGRSGWASISASPP